MTEAPTQSPRTLLVIDDDSKLVELLAAYLGKHGYAVTGHRAA